MSIHPSAPSDSLTAHPPTPPPEGTLFKFTSIASPSASALPSAQADFFRATTLPLVADFLRGENCLLFAYGTTGSGKTYTVQGGEGEKAGLLPRVLGVVLGSLQGRLSKAAVRPSGNGGIEVGEVPKMGGAGKAGAQGLGHRGISNLDSVMDEIDSKHFLRTICSSCPTDAYRRCSHPCRRQLRVFSLGLL